MAVIRINQLAARAVRYPDGTVEITFSPEDSDDVVIEIMGTTDDDARGEIVRAFAEYGGRVAATMETEA